MSYWRSAASGDLTPIKHLARFNPDVLPEDTDPDFQFDYIDIGGVTLEEGVRHKEPMRFEAAPSRARKPVRSGDVIVSTVRTYLKAVAKIDDANSGAVVSTGFAVLRPKARVDADYLYRLCQADPFLGDVQAQSTGVSYPAINPSALAAIKVPLPDLDTQKAIARYLDRETARIDQLIAKKERQVIALTEKLSRTIEAATNTGEPTRLKQLRNFLTSGSRGWGDNYADDGSLFIRIGNVTGRGIGVDFSDTAFVQIPSNSEGTRTSIKAGDLLISITAELGAVAVADERCEGGFVNQHVALLRLSRGKANARYLAYALRNDRSRQQFAVLGYGGTKQGLSLFDVGELSVRLPLVAVQAKTAAKLDQASALTFQLQDAIEKSVRKLKERRAALITAAVAGQIDVRQSAAAIATKPDRAKFRLIVGAEIVHRHQNTKRFGRIKNQKLLFLAEAHAGISELAGDYVRFAAGPYDAGLIDETERTMEAASYFRAQPPNGDSKGVTYVALPKAGRHTAELNALLGDRAGELRKLIDLLHDFDTEAVEAIATLYAVWNDALMDGQQPGDDAIVREVLTEWHRDKAKFTGDTLRHWLAWMKRNSVIPRGQGPRTAYTMTRDMFT